MSIYKDTMTENDMVGIVAVSTAPVQQVEKSEIEAATKRMSVIVADAHLMSTAQLATIAQESILYRTVPGRDVHYFLNRGKLSRVLDYKYLKNFATFKEQILSDSDSATLDDSYRPLTEQEKIEHNLTDDHIAAICTITTQRERDIFGGEVKRWLDMGFAADMAIKMAKEAIGGLGTSAIGAILKSESVPKGWSHMQLAEKLAFKNAVNRKYGLPTADEMAMMAYRMAQRATPKHWKNIDPTLPIEAQAKTANLNAITDGIKATSEGMTAAQRSDRLNGNVTILRGDDEGAIGDDYSEVITGNDDDWLRFVELVKFRVPFFYGPDSVKAALDFLKLDYDVDNEELLFDELAKYASNEADKEPQ